MTTDSLRKAMHRYLNSDKGKATRKKWIEANREKMSEYYKKYNVRLRNKCRALKICIRCHNNPAKGSYVQCETCLERFRTAHKPKEKCDVCSTKTFSLFNRDRKWLCEKCKNDFEKKGRTNLE